ncbi:hypothetical protein QFZ51_003530 [Chitinophaga sp. W3I9]|uniref:hypothetical protein n=1 Tax=Chitinophaga sp. W3I9 TaxID=3373924 RepID=UPI003D22E058
MYTGHSLRSNLQEWRNRLYRSDIFSIENNYRFFWEKVAAITAIQGILQQARGEIGIDPDRIEKIKEMGFQNSQALTFESMKQAAVYLYHLHTEHLIKQPGRTVVVNYGSGRDFSSQLRSFGENFVEPILNYLHDQLDEDNSVLYLLEKYKRRTEWFLGAGLLARYRNATANYEQILKMI